MILLVFDALETYIAITFLYNALLIEVDLGGLELSAFCFSTIFSVINLILFSAFN
jgi:hypothetical protein